LVKLKGVEYFAINAPMKEPHFSHFSLDEALHVAYLVGAQKSFITHISHRMGRHALINPQLPDYAELAYDGLKLEIG
jgi:phosphoribosyl 1,2-cyclic phosphate phosphodiesterase